MREFEKILYISKIRDLREDLELRLIKANNINKDNKKQMGKSIKSSEKICKIVSCFAIRKAFSKGIFSTAIAVSLSTDWKFKPARRYTACCLATLVAKATEASDTFPSSWWILPLKYRNQCPELTWCLFGRHFTMPWSTYLIVEDRGILKY